MRGVTRRIQSLQEQVIRCDASRFAKKEPQTDSRLPACPCGTNLLVLLIVFPTYMFVCPVETGHVELTKVAALHGKTNVLARL